MVKYMVIADWMGYSGTDENVVTFVQAKTKSAAHNIISADGGYVNYIFSPTEYKKAETQRR